MNFYILLGVGFFFSYKIVINFSFKVDFFCFGVSYNYLGKFLRVFLCNGV